jgi:hypothetical protein
MSRRAWLAFAAISLIWGIPYLLIRIAVRHGVTLLGESLGAGAVAGLLLILAGSWLGPTADSRLGSRHGRRAAACADRRPPRVRFAWRVSALRDLDQDDRVDGE